MVTTKAARTNASTYVIHDMNARAFFLMEHGMNQEAVQLLDEAVRYVGTYYLRHKRDWYDKGMVSNAYDRSAQQLQATCNADICVDVDPNANAFRTTRPTPRRPTVASASATAAASTSTRSLYRSLSTATLPMPAPFAFPSQTKRSRQ
jgi:phosphoribosyl-AMP cyclohydrolase